MSQGTQLKRSQKTEFSPIVTRERSFVRPNKDPQKRRSQTMATIKGKPTMEIYRPPNVRTDIPNSGKLNVHAKEFTMSHELQPSKSSGNLAGNFDPIQLQHSKSSGNILRHPTLIPIISTPLPLPLLHSTSSSHILNLPRVSYQFGNEILAHNIFTQKHTPVQTNWNNYQQSNNLANLKRSKSLGASDSHNLAAKLKEMAKEDIDVGIFPAEHQANLKLAMEDPNQISSRVIMDLVKVIMEQVVEGMRYCETGAKLCLSIIEKEQNQTFLESLLNMCQQWYQERDKILRGVKAGDGTRFTAFMWFLTEMCGQLKRHHIKEQYEALQPDLVLLSVLAKCCQACVSLPIKCLSETECLFFVLTSIGRDLETELPQQLEQLLASVRDGFLASAGAPAVRRTLLQLIELHASNWQLPGSSVLYYYPRIK
ncbi:MIF4G domain-containing protein [Tribolium madens]|uniref:MIF4G domain-containing protein n=1 Tax=Tribolium madens TaxID=41895 RepID=UPI001CF71F6E|nr:MIF4G domain-containing protein [Tribolium madens]XP_044266606.1 MIF4G domain-containing protein [Tribolium madens]